MTLRPSLTLPSVALVWAALAAVSLACGGGGSESMRTSSDASAGGSSAAPDGRASVDAPLRGTPEKGSSSDAGSHPGTSGDASTPPLPTDDAEVALDAYVAPTDGGNANAVTGPLIQTFVGINGFNWNTPADLSVAGSVREYTDWSWTEGTSPYPHNENDWYDWNRDAFYAGVIDAGLNIMPCIEQGVSFVNDGGIPPANGDPSEPASYAAHADHLFQFAARYASQAVDKGLLKDDAGEPWAFPEPALTGLDEVHYYENGNETDATWILPGGAPLESAADMAANCSADYDGDQGRMGATFGVKQADPNAKMVLAGLSEGASYTAATTYLQGMLDWSNEHRGGSVPFDVINLHIYSFGQAHGVSPEQWGLLALTQQFTAWRDANMPGKEIWITEFGYDTDSASPLGVPAIGDNSVFIVQGQWLIRSMLAMLQGGIDRAYIYWLADQACSSYCAVQFNTCGLIDVNSDKKAAYYMVNAFRTRLGTMRYLAPVTSTNTNVDILSFADTSGAGGAYVLWAPTSNATVVNGYSLPVASGATMATEVILADQQMTGTASPLTISGGAVSIDVSETPTIVLVDHL